MMVAIVFFVLPSSSGPPLQPQAAQTGITVKGCFLAPSGEQFGCNESKKVPVALNSVSVGGRDIAAITIPSAYGSFNHTGEVESWKFTATEAADSNYSISLSASGNPPERWNFTLPKSSWSESELTSIWSASYGEKVFRVTLVNPMLEVKFSNGHTVSALSQFNYVTEFKLDYSAPPATTTTTSTGTYTVTTTVTQTTTVESGSISSGTEDAWATTTEAATGGASGNISPDGVIMTRSPSTTNYGWTSVWVFIPSNFLEGKGWSCGGSLDGRGCFFVNVVSKDSSVGIGPYWFKDNNWYGIQVPIGASSENTIVILNGYVPDRKATDKFVVPFDQIVPLSSPVLNDAPPSPYDSQYQRWLAQHTPPSNFVIGYDVHGNQISLADTQNLWAGQDASGQWYQLAPTGEWVKVSSPSFQTVIYCYRPNGDPEYIESKCFLYSTVTVRF